ETRVDSTFAENRAYPQELAETGHISLSQTQVAQQIGQLFIVNGLICNDSHFHILSFKDGIGTCGFRPITFSLTQRCSRGGGLSQGSYRQTY
ncbi:MAG: hypothetical protein HN882_06630, partial [Planctomycetaceae bacterium]|nr:hypothetical protein [Planctomycetaceae bacterium]